MTAPIALTLGDPVGVGPEIAVKTADLVRPTSPYTPVLVGDIEAAKRGAQACGVTTPLISISHPGQAGHVDGLAVWDTGVLGTDLPEWGKVDARAGKAAVTAIEWATKAAMDKEVTAVVTAPINKEAIWASGSTHLGHTEMLKELTGAAWSDTMFVVRNGPTHLRIFFSTRHVALRVALEQLRDPELVSQAINRAVESLKAFGVDHPRLGVAAVNPHGGENGNFGDEEIISIRPACEDARKRGLDVHGPIPADSVFHQGLEGRFDGVLSHFHDQGHIPAKTVDFNGTISVTVGLPILRTSVDHGTAFDIAGTGVANHLTMQSAFEAAVDYAPFVPKIRQAYLS
ncbi:4-hydroxythreonine-4-phosphate dehydrogenase PdxA [Stomatohabitans albus]|uniref:4-hydroxythreonine-4-phosphate dehydrogenase PdxA n=1 Tax=Stomatohabitans albus TaxID=3110766 RepID=UPI00300C24E4